MARRKRIARVEVPRLTGRRRAVELVKTGVIALLVCSAIYLTGRTQLYTGGLPGSGWLGGLVGALGGEQPLPNAESMAARAVAAQPVRIAVCTGEDKQGGRVRYAVQYDVIQTDKLFDSLSSFLSEGLASAQNRSGVTEARWRQALQEPGLYFDLLGSVPLRALHTWLGAGEPNAVLRGDARRLLLAYGGGDTATLYYINESDGLYYACETSVTYTGYLEDEIAKYSAGVHGTSFAFELDDASYAELYPYVLISDTVSAGPRIYQGENPLADEIKREILQQTLSFPNIYDVTEGVVVWEGSETLRISSTGVATFQEANPAEPRYPVPNAGETPDASEMIEAARGLAARTVGATSGAARLYLMDLLEQEDGSWEVRFGYSLDGAAVQISGADCAASFLIREGRIDAFTLQFRSYEDTGDRMLVMREKQAAAALAALSGGGRELLLCYRDTGGETVAADWAYGE